MPNMNAKLPVIIPGEKPPVLFLGNGINLLFQGMPWKEIVAEFARESGIEIDQYPFGRLPVTMQIVAVSNNHIDSKMGVLAEKLLSSEITEAQREFLLKILSVPAEQIVTTNYTYEIEQALSSQYSRGRAPNSTFFSVDKIDSSNDMMLHRFTRLPLESNYRYIWHIHGLAYKPSSITIGHYYYGRLISQIQRYIGNMMVRYKRAESQGKLYEPKSWVDYFLMGDVHMLGFGMDTSEFELWWLTCCKQRNFSDSKIYFYTRGIEPERELLMRSYGIQIINCEGERYLDSYESALREIRKRMEKKL